MRFFGIEMGKCTEHPLPKTPSPSPPEPIKPVTKKDTIQIISDGRPMNTKILDENGNMVKYVERVVWECVAGEGVTKCTLYMANVPVNVKIKKENVEVVND